MWFSIDFSSHVPVYKQIVEKIKIEIIQGNIKKGEFLPSIRKMADTLGVNLNTVSKAYRELVNEGVVEPVRGEGYIVKKEHFEKFNKLLLMELEESIEKCIKAGISYETILKVLDKKLGRLKNDSKS
ncbi:GntR family transcriptional regulator [Thermosipho atlanticus]|uniref:Transcriptional regulator, GntR family n=1 Tax=Thermosipho atlanticus DSM 15807 TaxID=1123380 RepID=A0A1M5U5M7_9BACT|nr:GntR family transcriptional regulator [Thermosipho atlanticus]SHH58156.1 transcriptional regulator, GntR family [Thermosipho atlanticus DSM 15807]